MQPDSASDERLRVEAEARRAAGRGGRVASSVREAVRGSSRWIERGSVVAAMALVVWFLHVTAAANRGFDDLGEMDYFQLLVRGWKKGQLHLDYAPAPELLALPDPYDPAQNAPYKLADATLYKGKYYVYFGPTPALTLMLPYALITGREMTMGQAAFGFCTLTFFAASGLWLAIRRRYFPASRALMAPLGVLAIGFGTHLLAIAQRPMIWELPIAGGVAFSLLAMAAAYGAIHGRRPLLAMALAGLFLGLAVGSRPTCLLASALLLAPIWDAWRDPRAGRSWLPMALAAAIPVGLCGLAIMAHNYARFDHPLEWGQTYQLSGAYEGKLTHFSLRFLPHNLAVYFFQLLRWTAEFPFALAVGIQIDHIAGYFGTEEVAGLAVTFPFVWFALALPLAWRGRDAGETRKLAATLAAVAGGVVPVMALMMCYFSTTTRYQTDFAVGFAVIALVGLLALEHWAQRREGAWRSALVTTLATASIACTVVIGVLMSFDYHNRSLQLTAPERWETLSRGTYETFTNIGRMLGQIEGPRVLKVRFQPQSEGTVETFWAAADARAGERIVVEHIGDHLIRFGYARGAAPVAWGRPLRWETNHTHTVSVQLPSLYPAIGDGWWAGVERPIEFRKRTCAAVWFSGRRALGVVVERLPAEIAAGGSIGRDFSGAVRKMAMRVYRADEVESGLADPHAPRGGVLRLRVVFPERIQEKGEPIFAAGAHYESSVVFVEAAANGQLRFVFENFAKPRVESEPFRPDPAGHTVELEMASFDPAKLGEEATGDVVVRLDGREMMRTRQVAYHFPWGGEQIGRNPFGTTSAAEFRGWIYDVRWVR